MKNLGQTIKQSQFAIFTMIVLVGAVLVVMWFNTVVTTNITPPNSSTTSTGHVEINSNREQSLQLFDSATANRIRDLTPAAEVSTAPAIGIEGRINPFAE